MPLGDVILEGSFIRLEPLAISHVDGLTDAASADPSLYRWTPVPQGREAMAKYVEAALALRDAGSAVPFAIVRIADASVAGCTRFFDLDRWAWPEGHPRHGRAEPDGCEIGYTWLTKSAVRTAVNTEAKLLLLTHAFETWEVFRICFHADVRNERSCTALERLGARREGTLRAHRLAIDLIPRDSARYRITADEWPALKERLRQRLIRS